MELEKSNVCYVRNRLRHMVLLEVMGHLHESVDCEGMLQQVLCICSNLRRLLDEDEKDSWEEAIREVEKDMKELEEKWSR